MMLKNVLDKCCIAFGAFVEPHLTNPYQWSNSDSELRLMRADLIPGCCNHHIHASIVSWTYPGATSIPLNTP